jgi:GNAT superfamily N-acetyltransferase
MAGGGGHRIVRIDANCRPDVLTQLAQMQTELLPKSLVSRLGESFAHRFYAYCSRSEQEVVLAVLQGNRVLGASLLSLDPGTLDWRLLTRTPMALFAARHFHRLPLPALLRETMAKASARPDSGHLPELVLIFVGADCRGRGLGAELVAACEAFLDAQGIRAYTVSTAEEEGNRALNFYLAQGFMVAGRPVRHGLRYILLQKTLGPSVATDR